MEDIVFTVNDVEYKVRKPTQQELRKAKAVYSKAFNEALEADAPLQAKSRDILTRQKLWDKEKEKELEAIQRDMNDREYILEMNPNGISKQDARAVAIELRKLRIKKLELLIPLTDFNKNTAEGIADNAKFDYLLSVCVVYSDGRQYFSSYDDYIEKNNDPVAIAAANKFADMFYGVLENFQAELAENQFLTKYGFADDKFRLIDAKGRLIDESGHLVNESGQLIDEDGDLVDGYGHKIDEKGNFLGKPKPFTD
jgi:hypothetical protein